jgi:hypothetical protein
VQGWRAQSYTPRRSVRAEARTPLRRWVFALVAAAFYPEIFREGSGGRLAFLGSAAARRLFSASHSTTQTAAPACPIPTRVHAHANASRSAAERSAAQARIWPSRITNASGSASTAAPHLQPAVGRHPEERLSRPRTPLRFPRQAQNSRAPPPVICRHPEERLSRRRTSLRFAPRQPIAPKQCVLPTSQPLPSRHQIRRLRRGRCVRGGSSPCRLRCRTLARRRNS